jgi:transcriptional regulator with XRE-family HTH domain
VAERTLPPLSARLKELRQAAGMSQQALAVAAGLSVSMVSQLEQGNRSDPRISTIKALADALGVTLEEMTAGGGTPGLNARKSLGPGAGVRCQGQRG